MIYYDITKMGAAQHRSGLMRVSGRLQEELGSSVTPVTWDGRRQIFVSEKSVPVVFAREDWFFTVELFSEEERPGFSEFVRAAPCRLGAIVHDAIPLKWPHIVWPQSVRRHAVYMKLVASFDRVWANSEATRQEFIGFWRWQGMPVKCVVDVVALGADFDGGNRVCRDPLIARGRPALLCVGIVEPRKNQGFLLDVAEALWRDGVDFSLAVAGRVNPHFGGPLQARMKALQKREERFRFHLAPGDRELGRLYAAARAVVVPTMAEGCGLPLWEALWRGVPCVASDLPVLRENVAGGGCLLARLNDRADWQEKLRVVLTNPEEVRRLQGEAMDRPLPRWADTAQTIRRGLG